MINPLISVIVPTYNYGHLISEALDSILYQTYTNWECLIIDDGSSDNTEEVVSSYIIQDKRFKYTKIVNSGTSAAKNKGIELAAGQYIQFLDADDLLSPRKFQIQVNAFVDDNIALVFSESKFFLDKDKIRMLCNKFPIGYLADKSLENEELIQRLILNNIITISSPLVRTELVKEIGMFTTSLRNNEDWLFWFRIAISCPKFIYDSNPDSYVLIRVHANSAMTNHLEMYKGEVVVRRSFDQYLEGQNIVLNHDLLAIHNIRSLNPSEGYLYILKNMPCAPAHNLKLLTLGIYKSLVRLWKYIQT